MTGIFCSQFKQISQYVINKNNGHTEYLKWTIVSITTVDTVIDLDWYFYMKNKFRFIQVYKTKLALLFYVFTVSFKEKNVVDEYSMQSKWFKPTENYSWECAATSFKLHVVLCFCCYLLKLTFSPYKAISLIFPNFNFSVVFVRRL